MRLYNLVKGSPQIICHPYHFSISEITSYVHVNPNTVAQIRCVVDANPIDDDTVRWLKFDPENPAKPPLECDGRPKKFQHSREGNAFCLTILNVTQADSGEFTCIVKNPFKVIRGKVEDGINKPDDLMHKAHLFVKSKYKSIYY